MDGATCYIFYISFSKLIILSDVTFVYIHNVYENMDESKSETRGSSSNADPLRYNKYCLTDIFNCIFGIHKVQ